MKKIICLIVLVFGTTSGVVLAENIIKGPGPSECPTSDKCGSCHSNTNTYDELLQSSHEELSCFDCHLPSLVQKTKYERQDRSFSRLGHHLQDNEWHEALGNDACLRCHEDRKGENMSETCWSCHMPVTGMDEIAFMKDKTKPLSEENTRAVKKLPHRSHLFKFHPEN